MFIADFLTVLIDMFFSQKQTRKNAIFMIYAIIFFIS